MRGGKSLERGERGGPGWALPTLPKSPGPRCLQVLGIIFLPGFRAFVPPHPQPFELAELRVWKAAFVTKVPTLRRPQTLTQRALKVAATERSPKGGMPRTQRCQERCHCHPAGRVGRGPKRWSRGCQGPFQEMGAEGWSLQIVPGGLEVSGPGCLLVSPLQGRVWLCLAKQPCPLCPPWQRGCRSFQPPRLPA